MRTHFEKHINERGLLFPWEIVTAQHAQSATRLVLANPESAGRHTSVMVYE
jgi:hypothetical protein